MGLVGVVNASAVQDGGGSWTWSFHGHHFSLRRNGWGEMCDIVHFYSDGLLLKDSWVLAYYMIWFGPERCLVGVSE